MRSLGGRFRNLAPPFPLSVAPNLSPKSRKTAGLPPGYSARAVARVLGVSEGRVQYWVRLGFVSPSLKVARRRYFSFRDLVGARVVKELIERGFDGADIEKAVETIQLTLPEVDAPVERIRVTFDGSALLLRQAAAAITPGQRIFDFELSELTDKASTMEYDADVEGLDGNPSDTEGDTEAETGRTTPDDAPEEMGEEMADGAVDGPARPDGETFDGAMDAADVQSATAYRWFLEGLRRETEDETLDEAVACYQRATELDPDLACAHTNLGVLQHVMGDPAAARTHFEAALESDGDQTEARYNLANLLMDTGDLKQRGGRVASGPDGAARVRRRPLQFGVRFGKSGRTKVRVPAPAAVLATDPGRRNGRLGPGRPGAAGAVAGLGARAEAPVALAFHVTNHGLSSRPQR